MILYIIRHAWAGHFGDPEWPDDFQRPLSAKGKTRFVQVVQALGERGFRPEIVATSPLVRCRQTAEIVVEQVAEEPRLVELDELQPNSDLAGLIAWTAREAAAYEQVAWVGHAPDVGDITATLIGQPGAFIRFAKGAAAAIEFDEQPSVGQGALRWLVTAKMLGC